MRAWGVACDAPAMADVVERFLARLGQVERASDSTQKAAAEEAGLTPAAIGYWKRRDHSPSLDNLEVYAKALGGELIVDVYHPNEGKHVLLATKAGSDAARLVESMAPDDQELILKVLRAIPEHHDHRETIRGMLRDIIRALGALRGETY